jgi:hypothetical protein
MTNYERDRVRQQQKANAVIVEVLEALQPLRESDGLRHMQALSDAISRMADPPRFDELMDDYEMQMELLRAFEVHGEGLRSFSVEHVAVPGEVLIGSDRSVWIVSAVDDDGRITEIAGATASRKAREIALVWRVDSSPRRWLAAEQVPAPAYSDVGRALTHITRTWGEHWREGRNLVEPAGLLLELFGAPGLKLRAGKLTENADDAAILAFTQARGGTIAFEPGIVVPGDVVRLSADRRWGVITRVDGEQADIVVGGGRRAGPLGEPRDTVQLRRGQPLTSADLIWKPQARSE